MEIFDILNRFGADIKWSDGKVICEGKELNSLRIDASQIPDLVPILGVLMAFPIRTAKFSAQRDFALRKAIAFTLSATDFLSLASRSMKPREVLFSPLPVTAQANAA